MHPDGRVQRLRAAIGRAKGATQGGGVRAGWQVIADVAARAGHDLGVAAGPMASRQLFEAVPFYAGLTLDLDRRARRALARARVGREVRGAAVGAGHAEDPARGPRAAAHEGRAAPRDLPLAVELQGGRRLAGAQVPAPAAGGRALAARRRAPRRGRGRPRRARLQRHARARPGAPARCGPARHGVHRRGHPGPAVQRADRRRSCRSSASAAPTCSRAPSRSRSRPRSRASPRRLRRRRSRSRPPTAIRGTAHERPRRGRLLRGLVDPAPQGRADLRRRVPARADHPARRAQAARALPAPLRPQPRRALRDAAADGRHRQARLQGAVPAAHVDRLAVRDRARDLDDDRRRDGRDHPVLGHRRHLRHAGRALRRRHEHRHPLRLRVRRHRLLRADAGRLGVGLEVLLPRLDARRRAADLLRGLAGPRDHRRRHAGGLAVADGDRPLAGGQRLVHRSRSSSAS